VVNALGEAPEYQGKVLFLEHNVDDANDPRRSKWWTRKHVDDPSASSATTPLILVDGGRTYGDGRTQPFDSKYRALVDEALTEPPQVAIDAHVAVDADHSQLLVSGNITNIGDITMGYDNTATLWYIVFEHTRVIHVDWFVRRAVFQAVDDDIGPGQTVPFDKAIVMPAGLDLEAQQVVVMLEYKPADAGGAYWSANAALASSGAEPTQEATEEPTVEPTVEPTAEPSEEPSQEPTTEPTEATVEPTLTPQATEEPSQTAIFLPIGYRLSAVRP
jgi:hypothetical protein